MTPKKTLVLGASTNPERYSYKAIQFLTKYNQEIVAIGNKKGKVLNTEIITEQLPFEHIHTITMYLGKARQTEYINYVLSLHPKRIIFNPGAENDELMKLAKQQNIECVEACTLVMLNTCQF